MTPLFVDDRRQSYDGVHLRHHRHAEFVHASMGGREDAGRWIVTVALVDLSIFEDDHVGSIGIHREHFL